MPALHHSISIIRRRRVRGGYSTHHIQAARHKLHRVQALSAFSRRRARARGRRRTVLLGGRRHVAQGALTATGSCRRRAAPTASRCCRSANHIEAGGRAARVDRAAVVAAGVCRRRPAGVVQRASLLPRSRSGRCSDWLEARRRLRRKHTPAFEKKKTTSSCAVARRDELVMECDGEAGAHRKAQQRLPVVAQMLHEARHAARAAKKRAREARSLTDDVRVGRSDARAKLADEHIPADGDARRSARRRLRPKPRR